VARRGKDEMRRIWTNTWASRMGSFLRRRENEFKQFLKANFVRFFNVLIIARLYMYIFFKILFSLNVCTITCFLDAIR
jgi:hypothetical protein